MTPLCFEKSKFVCVYFTGGTGGNHIGNMLSLCDEFENKIPDYENFLIRSYSSLRYKENSPAGIKAHFNDDIFMYDIYDVDKWKQLKESKKKSLIIGHWQSLIGLNDLSCTNPVIIPDMSYVLIEFPKVDSFAYKRIQLCNYNPCSTNYTFPLKSGLNNIIIDDNNGFSLDTELIFTDEGSDYLREKVKSNWGTDLPKAADTLHFIWMKWMKFTMTLTSNTIKPIEMC